MAIPGSINSLLRDNTVEWARIEFKKSYITTTLVNETGILRAKQDGNYHYSVVYVNNKMSDWISSYSIAKTNQHQYTRILKEICFYVSGI